MDLGPKISAPGLAPPPTVLIVFTPPRPLEEGKYKNRTGKVVLSIACSKIRICCEEDSIGASSERIISWISIGRRVNGKCEFDVSGSLIETGEGALE